MNETEIKVQRAAVVHRALSRVGLPFSHQQMHPDIGFDCVGLLRDALHEIGWTPLDEGTPALWTAYAQRPEDGLLTSALLKEFVPIPLDDALEGDVIEMAYGGARRHLAIVARRAGVTAPPSLPMSVPPQIVHSTELFGVALHDLDPHWWARATGCYRLKRWA